jgi:hypothetical protein
MYKQNIHALSGARNHDPDVRASEDSSRRGPRSHCDRQLHTLQNKIFKHLDIRFIVTIWQLIQRGDNTQKEISETS